MNESRTHELALAKTHFASAGKVITNLTQSEATRLAGILNGNQPSYERLHERWRWANLNEITRVAGCVVIDGEQFRDFLASIQYAEDKIREAVEKS